MEAEQLKGKWWGVHLVAKQRRMDVAKDTQQG